MARSTGSRNPLAQFSVEVFLGQLLERRGGLTGSAA